MTNVSPPPSKRRRVAIASTSGRDGLEEEGVVTIFSWNINGISPFIQQSITSFFNTTSKNKDQLPPARTLPKASLRDFLRRHRWPTALFLQEIKINPDDGSTIRAVQHAVKPQAAEPPEAPEYVVDFCLPSDKYNARGFGRKIYGVCSIVRKDFFNRSESRFRTVDWDTEGRFLVLETTAAAGIPKLAFINIYAVNGTDNAYKNPATGDVDGTRHDRKLEVHAKLQQECDTLHSRGYGVVLAGDMNIARSVMDGHPNLRTIPQQHCKNRADFEARFFGGATKGALKNDSSMKDSIVDFTGGLGMIDTFRHLHPTKRGYSYYPRGRDWGDSCDRVDMIIVSSSLEHTIASAGMHETPGERGPSDHVPIWVALNFGRISSGQTATPSLGVEGDVKE